MSTIKEVFFNQVLHRAIFHLGEAKASGRVWSLELYNEILDQSYRDVLSGNGIDIEQISDLLEPLLVEMVEQMKLDIAS